MKELTWTLVLGFFVPAILLMLLPSEPTARIRALWAVMIVIMTTFVLGMAALGRTRWRDDRDPLEGSVALAIAAFPIWMAGILVCLMSWIPGEPLGCWGMEEGIWVLGAWVLTVPLVAAGLDFRMFLKAIGDSR